MKENEAIKYIENHGYISDDVKDMTIKALEKQIPKKPFSHRCNTCGSAVLPFEGSCCSNCGQKLD